MVTIREVSYQIIFLLFQYQEVIVDCYRNLWNIFEYINKSDFQRYQKHCISSGFGSFIYRRAKNRNLKQYTLQFFRLVFPKNEYHRTVCYILILSTIKLNNPIRDDLIQIRKGYDHEEFDKFDRRLGMLEYTVFKWAEEAAWLCNQVVN